MRKVKHYIIGWFKYAKVYIIFIHILGHHGDALQ
jgi:hypothetical protein